jgi:hypothetical protein
MQVLQLSPKIVLGKSKYKCRYFNETPKFQLVEVSMGVYYNETPHFQLVEINISVGITSLNEKSTLNVIPTRTVT